ncbi:uncharacterized protein LOC121062381 [Cygnus olor]|uniref:uncharacterized protein LOC121062381 n=1 Tax=Cygnus olor TaxID=8869 RepID=UPI001ADE499F|nr:uncharacterized protein LOC121062381 [Cygnus olor]
MHVAVVREDRCFHSESPRVPHGCLSGPCCSSAAPVGELDAQRPQQQRADAEGGSAGGPGGALPCSLLGGGVDGPWSCASPVCLSDPLRPPSSSCGAIVAGPWAQVVAALRGSAAEPLPGGVPMAASGRSAHVLLVVVVRSHRVQDAVNGLPAERARRSRGSPPLDAAEAEGVETCIDVGGVSGGAQADGALFPCRCLRWPRLLHLAPAGCCCRAALLQILRGTGWSVLPEGGGQRRRRSWLGVFDGAKDPGTFVVPAAPEQVLWGPAVPHHTRTHKGATQ